MKKSIIAAGAASVALAAMPIMGVFAIQDTVQVEVGGGCNFASRTDGTANFSTVAPGADGTAQTTAAMVLTCNDGWTLTPSTTGLQNKEDSSIVITSNNTEGDVSTFKLALEVASAPSGLSNNFSSANVINGTNKVSYNAASTSLSITPTYSIHISTTQAPGEYEGTVTYIAATN